MHGWSRRQSARSVGRARAESDSRICRPCRRRRIRIDRGRTGISFSRAHSVSGERPSGDSTRERLAARERTCLGSDPHWNPADAARPGRDGGRTHPGVPGFALYTKRCCILVSDPLRRGHRLHRLLCAASGSLGTRGREEGTHPGPPAASPADSRAGCRCRRLCVQWTARRRRKTAEVLRKDCADAPEDGEGDQGRGRVIGLSAPAVRT